MNERTNEPARVASIVNYGTPWRIEAGDREWLVIDRYGAIVLHCKARGIAEFVVATPELYAACLDARIAIDTMTRGTPLAAEEAFRLGGIIGGAIHKAEQGR